MKTELEKNEKELKKAMLLIVFGFLIMVLSALLPFATANEEYRAYLQKNADMWEIKEVGLTKGDSIDISIAEYIRMYSYAAGKGVGEEIAITFLVLIGIVIFMGILCVEGAVHKHPKGVIVADIISSIVYAVMAMDFVGRGVIGESRYKFGFGVYVYGVAIIVILMGAILMIRAGKQVKNGGEIGEDDIE